MSCRQRCMSMWREVLPDKAPIKRFTADGDVLMLPQQLTTPDGKK